MGFKHDLPNEGSVCSHVAVNEPNVPQTSTIRRSRTVIRSVLWFVASGALVAEIWPFQVLEGCGVQKSSLLVVCSWSTRTLHSRIGFTHGLHTGIHGLHAPRVQASQKCHVNHAQTMCKPDHGIIMPRGAEIVPEYHDVPSVYGASGCAKSDSTT